MEALQRLARQQLFFVGGAPRSGTTWLQHVLDAHPDIRCGGEGLFMKHLAEPLHRTMAGRQRALIDKNETIFRYSGGFPLCGPADTELLIVTAILLALEQLCGGTTFRAIGEKTPENVFFFPHLKRLLPTAKFIGIARDPRDTLSSAWHFFHKVEPGENPDEAKRKLIADALPAVTSGLRGMLTLRKAHPSDCLLVTYERMRAAPETVAGELYRFLGVADDEATVAACAARTSFAAMSGGRPAGMTQDRSFFRKGVVGDWRSTFTPDMGEMIAKELAWAFPLFGWKP